MDDVKGWLSSSFASGAARAFGQLAPAGALGAGPVPPPAQTLSGQTQPVFGKFREIRSEDRGLGRR
jgi:hypothetical protein